MYCYGANNPVKYVDPDGNQITAYDYWGFMKSITSGTDKFFSKVMQYVFSDRSDNKVNPDYLILKLNEMNYKKVDNNVVILKSRNSYNLEISFLLTGDFVKNLSTALPAQSDATLEDIADIKNGYSAGVLGLSVAGKMTRGIGNITFNYTIIDGSVTDWSLTEKTTDGKNILYYTYTKTEAIEYLNKNKVLIYDKSKEFKKFLDKLD